MDDSYDENDTRSVASLNPALAPDLYAMVSCPSTTSSYSADQDWYKISITADSRVDVQIAGDGATDLDLHVYDTDGAFVTSSTSLNPDEEINTCLQPGTYYVKVNGYGHARSEYLLSYTKTAESCNTTCTDDSHEDDDTYSQARFTSFPYSSTGNQICPGDDDWYKVTLYSGDKLVIDLTFTQTSSTEDLDLHLYDSNGVDQWPCSPSNISGCTSAHGQSASSNEHAEFTAPSTCSAGCVYDVVVRGWNGSSNSYDITLGKQ